MDLRFVVVRNPSRARSVPIPGQSQHFRVEVGGDLLRRRLAAPVGRVTPRLADDEPNRAGPRPEASPWDRFERAVDAARDNRDVSPRDEQADAALERTGPAVAA